MKKLQLLFVVLYILGSSLHAVANPFSRELKGQVLDASSQYALVGASITIPDLKASAITNAEGKFHLSNLPNKGSFLIEVRYVGYKTKSLTVNLSEVNTLSINLESSAIEAQEVTITGSIISSASKRNSISASIVNKAQLLAPSSNLIDGLSKVPGVSQISTGPAISKPVIRGLSFNRVVVLDEGIKQQGQQWGDEHGLEVDQFKSDRVEILRGAASLMYGSDALGGVINLLEPSTAPNGELRGEIISNYSTNNGLTANSLMLAGNENGFVWQARGTYKNAHSYKTPTGYFPNSGFNETSLNAMLGLNRSWGYTHLNISSFKNHVGFYEPELNDDGLFVNEDDEPFTNADFKSRKVSLPSQKINHFKVSLNNRFILGSGYMKADLAFQQNIRKELEHSDDPSLNFNLKTYSGDLKYFFPEQQGWQVVLGLSSAYGQSANTGFEHLVPDYKVFDLGAFVYAKKSWDLSTLNLGLRYDFHKNDGAELLEAHGNHFHTIFNGFKNQFSNVSGALGFTHQISPSFNFKANAGTAFRAPNPAELGSNGVHHGAYRYEIGNANLKPERSYQVDASLDYESKYLSAGLSVYNNYINNYIYALHDGETIEVEDEHDHGGHSHTVKKLYPVYRYDQVNANLYGAELSLTLHPVSFIHFENSFAYTHAQNTSLNKPLPYIPAGTLHHELKFEPRLKGIDDTYFSIGLSTYLAQKRVDPQFETSTEGYSLWDLGLGATVKLGKQPVKLSVSAKNLLNKKYYDALSRLKPGRLDMENPTFGIYNAGRNISFGIYVPLSL